MRCLFPNVYSLLFKKKKKALFVEIVFLKTGFIVNANKQNNPGSNYKLFLFWRILS